MLSRVEILRKLEGSHELPEVMRLQGRAEQLRIQLTIPYEIDLRLEQFSLAEEKASALARQKQFQSERRLG